MPDSDALLREISARKNRYIAIKNGAEPTSLEVLSGLPFLGGSAELDSQAILDEAIPTAGLGLKDGPAISNALVALRRKFNSENLGRAIKKCEPAGLSELTQRLLIYHAYTGGGAGVRARVAAMAISKIKPNGFNGPFLLATAIGLVTDSTVTPTESFECGKNSLAMITKIRDLVHSMTSGEAPSDDDDDDFMHHVLEDRAESMAGFVRVVPPMAPGTSTGRKDIVRAFENVAGKRLPLVPRPDVVAVAAMLNVRFPWAKRITSILMRDLAGHEYALIKPTLLISGPGAGKSTYARAMLEACGLAVEMIPLAGTSDGSVAGTSAQWASARPSGAMQAIQRSGFANVGLVLDELDKSKSSHNGSAADALMPFLERSTAAKIRDPMLELEVDLSWVSWIATANDLALVPRPLRDRMRVLVMPTPGWQHIGALTKDILAQIAKDSGIDPGFLPSLAQDEIDLIQRSWSSGSIRQLRQIIEVIVDGREDQQIGRC